MIEKQNEINLKRTIGVFGLACAVVNITIGTGIFVLPAMVAERLGDAAIICFLICGVLIFLIGLCFAEVGSKVTDSGGTYTYIETAFGPFAGFLANNIFWFGSGVLSDAAIANGLYKTLGFFMPGIDSPTIRPLFFLLLFGGLALINIRGTSNGVRVIILMTLAKLIPLILLIVFGASRISAVNLEWKNAFTLNDIGSTTLILFFAFLGIETAVSNSGEIKNPARVIPLGIISGLSFVLLLYVSVQLVSQGILGDELILYKDAPLSEVSQRLFGYIGISIVTIGIAVSMLGSLSGGIFAIPRVIFAGARNAIFPSILAKVHTKYFTPYISIAIYATFGYLLSVFGTLKQLLVLSSAATLLIYLGVVLATIKLRYQTTTTTEKTFTIPGGLSIPIITAMIIIWILSNLTKEEMVGSSLALILLSLIYVIMRWYKCKQLPQVITSLK
jgi:basic amino acid/polyamine antiporter, APA family